MLLKNSLFNTGGRIIQIALSLIVIPIYITYLKTSGYGVYVSITTLVGLFGVVDFGLGLGLTKFIAEQRADTKYITKLLNISICMQICLALFFSLLIYFFDNRIVDLFHLEKVFIRDALKAVDIGAVTLLFNMIATILVSAIKGLERYDIVAKVFIVASITSNVIGLVLVINGFGLSSLMVAEAVVSFVIIVFNIIITKRIFQHFAFRIELDRNIVVQLLSYGWYISLTRIASQFYNRIPHFFIAYLLGAEFVTFYAVPSKIINAIKTLINTAGEVFMPWASRLAAESDIRQLRKTYLTSSTLFNFTAIAIYLFIIIMSFPLLTTWVGGEVAQHSRSVLAILSLCTIISSFSVIPVNMLLGLGHVRITALAAYYVLFVSVITIYPLIKWGGVDGAAVAILLSQSNVIFLIYKTNKILKINHIEYAISTFFRPIITIIIPIAITAFLVHKISSFNWSLLFALSILYCSSCLYLSTKTIPAINEYYTHFIIWLKSYHTPKQN